MRNNKAPPKSRRRRRLWWEWEIRWRYWNSTRNDWRNGSACLILSTSTGSIVLSIDRKPPRVNEGACNASLVPGANHYRSIFWMKLFLVARYYSTSCCKTHLLLQIEIILTAKYDRLCYAPSYQSQQQISACFPRVPIPLYPSTSHLDSPASTGKFDSSPDQVLLQKSLSEAIFWWRNHLTDEKSTTNDVLLFFTRRLQYITIFLN